MVTRLDGNLIVEHDYGVNWEGFDEMLYCENVTEAINMADDTGGQIFTRTVYITEWEPYNPEEDA